MPILDQRELVEELPPLGIGFDRRKRAVQISRIPFMTRRPAAAPTAGRSAEP
jgi:hypothetical protein